MPNLTVHSFEELEERLKNWINFSGEGDYDFVSMMLLLKACITNLRTHSLLADFENLEDFFSSEEIHFMQTLIEKCSHSSTNSDNLG